MHKTFEVPQERLIDKHRFNNCIYHVESRDIPCKFYVEDMDGDEANIFFVYHKKTQECVTIQHRIYLGKSGRLIGLRITISNKSVTLDQIKCLLGYLIQSSDNWVTKINYENCRIALTQDNASWFEEVLAWNS